MLNLEIIVQLSEFKKIILIIFAMQAMGSVGQTLNVYSKVEQGVIKIKWLPSDIAGLQKVLNGAKVSRVISTGLAPEDENFTSARVRTINSAKDELAKLSKENPENEKYEMILEPFLLGNKEKEQLNFAFGATVIENVINPDFQYVMGNALMDREITAGNTYAYKIEVQGMKTAYIRVNSDDRTSYPALSASLSLDQKKTVEVTWNLEAVRAFAFGFDIEHSIGSEQAGDFLNEKPHLPFSSDTEIKSDVESYRHEHPEQGKMHFYRVWGRDPFGEKTLVSDWMSIYVPLLIEAVPTIDTVTAIGKIRTVMGSIISLNSPTTIEKLAVYRSSNQFDSYQKIKEMTLTDSLYSIEFESDLSSGDAFYYRTVVTNQDDTVWSQPYYFFTLDQEPPAAPSALSAKIDSNGVVRLTWSKSPDKDVQGYKVYRANHKSEDFVEKTTHFAMNGSFMDTLPLNNLTSEIYYYVQAVDLNFNQSSPSDTLLVMKPDTIAPVASIIRDVTIVNGQFIEVNWVESSSEDVASIRLFRNGQEVAILNSTTPSYRDTNLIPGVQYAYFILTTDRSGNRSTSQLVSRFYEPGFRKPVNLSGSADRTNKQIVLKWEMPTEEVYHYEIKRGKNGEKMMHLTSIHDGGVTQFSDRSLEIGTRYSYTVKFVTKSGIHSIPAVVEVVY